MTDRTWHKGPPPHVGWWNASKARNKKFWRWWDGSDWSRPARFDDPLEYVQRQLLFTSCDAGDIEWTDYWPENARVPRVNPDAS